MYQIVIATPLGELGTKPFSEEEKSKVETELLKSLENLSILPYVSFVLEDGQYLYMTRDMIGRSVFFLRKVS
jgi:hypothetical protein